MKVDNSGKFLTREEIISDIKKTLGEKGLQEFASMSGNDLITLHHGFGTWVRNQYSLWDKDNPLLAKWDGSSDHPLHPDQYSNGIIVELHDRLNGR